MLFGVLVGKSRLRYDLQRGEPHTIHHVEHDAETFAEGAGKRQCILIPIRASAHGKRTMRHPGSRSVMRVTKPGIDRGMNLIVDFAQCCFGLGIGP
jgi:hypothetical protein